MINRLQCLICVASGNRKFLNTLHAAIVSDYWQAEPMGGLVSEYKYTVSLAFGYFFTEHLFQLLADDNFLFFHDDGVV